jgi:hypothetical protein
MSQEDESLELDIAERRFEHPLYGVACNRRGEVILCGGGGIAKTGVPNAMVCRKTIVLYSIRFFSFFFFSNSLVFFSL